MKKAQPKVPDVPPGPLARRDHDVCPVQEPMWRIMPTAGQYVLAWNQLRSYGPLATMRFDPHCEPASDQPERAVMYTATDITTAIAERFSKYRTVDPVTAAPQLCGWIPTRSLQLLDLTQDWALFNQAAHALTSARRKKCRAWARAILNTWPELDGIRYLSTMTGQHCYALFPAAQNSFPKRPAFAQLLTQPEVCSLIRGCATTINYDIVIPG